MEFLEWLARDWHWVLVVIACCWLSETVESWIKAARGRGDD